MAGGFNTPQLAAEVANAGGMVSLGFAFSAPDHIDRVLRDTIALTDGPLSANFFVFPQLKAPPLALFAESTLALDELPTSLHIETPPFTTPYAPDSDARLQAVWLHRPAVLTFHFGLSQERVIEQAYRQNIAVGVTATCVREPQDIARAGADFVMAQGWEAGGYRGCFDPSHPDEALPVLALVRSLLGCLSILIVAVGGMMDGRDIA